MSIQVRNLCKIYGQQQAVWQADFEVRRGHVAGLLGANGAGKSTIMKILMGFVAPTSGEAYIDGISTAHEPLMAKRAAGYLPEHNPLYLDMYVAEYLRFVYDIYMLPRHKANARIRSIMDITGLMPEGSKRIGQLSKGYRQRVGLAQALVHEPQVLILDEPTAGLDPNQLAEIRALIVKVGKEKTVILSTHIMQEVEAVCSSVIIMNKGKIIAHDTPHNIRRIAGMANAAAVSVTLASGIEQHAWSADFIDYAKQISPTEWLLYPKNNEDIRAKVFRYAVDNQWIILELKHQSQHLEEAFRALTM
jgi:ABC-2 type transport system ATP-binding protein